jgi:hypothetical protein
MSQKMKYDIINHNKVPVISKYKILELKITEDKLEVNFIVVYNHPNK